MSDWNFGSDYDMWLYPPVDWTAPDYDYELPESIEAADIEGTLLINAEDAIEQVRRLQAENAKLREYVDRLERHALANVPTSGMEETKAWLNHMRRLCWLDERW